eukprot:TRINITY_DN9261_c0_g1_i2.p1 TRINITY_DN9261_c0_g1~~TRINITY_DN9261_c0_g1_i2.p1  ORF type:complete len:415 (+),score=34.50 TRINITY_DN9261_c0_g1_i2:306-1550(+)
MNSEIANKTRVAFKSVLGIPDSMFEVDPVLFPRAVEYNFTDIFRVNISLSFNASAIPNNTDNYTRYFKYLPPSIQKDQTWCSILLYAGSPANQTNSSPSYWLNIFKNNIDSLAEELNKNSVGALNTTFYEVKRFPQARPRWIDRPKIVNLSTTFVTFGNIKINATKGSKVYGIVVRNLRFLFQATTIPSPKFMRYLQTANATNTSDTNSTSNSTSNTNASTTLNSTGSTNQSANASTSTSNNTGNTTSNSSSSNTTSQPKPQLASTNGPICSEYSLNDVSIECDGRNTLPPNYGRQDYLSTLWTLQTPKPHQIVKGLDNYNIRATKFEIVQIENISLSYNLTFSGLDPGVNYVVYLVAEDNFSANKLLMEDNDVAVINFTTPFIVIEQVQSATRQSIFWIFIISILSLIGIQFI